MVSIALLSNISPSPLSKELETWGYEVYEAISISEIMHLCEHRYPTCVVVAAGVEVYGLNEITQKLIVIQQNEGSTTQELVTMLTDLFGANAAMQ
jgi:hypothetical protein